jgi:magnesium transporter
VSATFVVAVRHGPANSLRDALIRSQPWEPRTMAGAPATAWAILDRVIDDYEPVLAGLERDIDEVERAVFEGGTDQTERIYLLRRELADMHRTVRPLLEPLEAIERGDYMSLEGDTPLYFRALADHARRLHEEVVTQRYLLEGVLQANLASIGVRQNEVVRKVSGWAGIITVPTLVASVYGMNFERMPELGWAFGYPFAIVLMLTCGAALWLLLRRVKWL